MNEELRELFEADQADRLGGAMPAGAMPAGAIDRDRARRRRVTELLAAGAAETADDFFHAAMVFQHGEAPEDYLRAHRLARRAAELGHGSGRWLAEAAYDRWLMRQGRPQRYGTQYTGRSARWWDPEPLVVCRVGEFEVQFVRRPPGGPVRPSLPLAPLQAGDLVPWLPRGLTAGRMGVAFGATDQVDELTITWYRAGTPVVLGWCEEEDGPLPELEPFEVAEAAAVWCGTVAGWTLLAIGRTGGRPWMVGGRRPREDLLRVAGSLP